MFIFIFILFIIILILQISILSTCSEINDNLLDIERSIRSIPKRFIRTINRKGSK